MDGSFTILEHPADMGIEAFGGTLRQAFEQAASGLMSIILETGTVESLEQRAIEIQASDYEQLLVKWLTEVLYLYDGQQFVPKEFRIKELTESSLKATLLGEPLRAEKHQTLLDVKAITYHQLCIEQHQEYAMVRVYIDI